MISKDGKRWKTIRYDFKSLLGIYPALVRVWDTEEEGVFFKPGEERRLERMQAAGFLSLVLEKKTWPTEIQIPYLKRILRDIRKECEL